ncbi:FkbM family methyltransferase [Thermicanus aegyptius]|uniref:FkbM family methyltransferase n=1 Tax=Thermicanus aegyptius TaxID=94009 RepID=UPI000416014A|nr:FkbM family methyltransferase [Thermicanus aegyptius]
MDRVSAYLGNYTYLTQLKYGPKIFLDTRELSLTAHIIADGLWESWITEVFVASLSPGVTVLDIGANCGYYSLLAAQLTGPSGRVHAFEPNPFHHENLIKSKLINGFNHLEIHPFALSDRNEEIILYAPAHLTASASMFEHLLKPLQHVDTIQPVRVPAVKLSDRLPGLKADVIKMDIEGAEPLILDEVLDIMERSGESKLFMEYNQKAWQMQGHDCEAILNHITARNFELYIIRHDQTLQSVTPGSLVEMTSEATHFDLLIIKGN